MIRIQRRRQIFLLFTDIAFIILASYLSVMLKLGKFIDVLTDYTGATVFSTLMYLVCFYLAELYAINKPFTVNLFFKVSSSVIVANMLSGFLFYSLPNWKFGRGIWFFQMAIIWALCITVRFILLRIWTSGQKHEKLLVIGAGKAAHFFYNWLTNTSAPYEIAGFVDDDTNKIGMKIGNKKVIGTCEQIGEIGKRVKSSIAAIAITYEKTPKLISEMFQLKLEGWRIWEMSRVYEQYTGRVPVHHIHNEWFLFTDGFYLLSRPILQKVKRLTDILVSTLLLVISFPITSITALSILLDSKGPVFYRQARTGKDQEVFILFKFRSMAENAEPDGAVWAKKNDSRVTRVGKWIRLLRIDEIPQLYNVLRGDMSLIGPRPERPEFIKDLEKILPFYQVRHVVRPGVTGWAQVNYRYGASVEDALNKLEYDLYYIKNMSLLLDVRIIAKTISVVLFAKGAR